MRVGLMAQRAEWEYSRRPRLAARLEDRQPGLGRNVDDLGLRSFHLVDPEVAQIGLLIFQAGANDVIGLSDPFGVGDFGLGKQRRGVLLCLRLPYRDLAVRLGAGERVEADIDELAAVRRHQL